MSSRDALGTLQTKHADLYSDSPIWVSLNRYAGPQNPPSILSPQQTNSLASYVEGTQAFVMDLSLLPLKEPLLPWSFENDNYFGAVVAAILSPIYVPVTFLRLSHLTLTKVDALSPLAGILEGLDLSYNQIKSVERDLSILSTFSRLAEVNLVGNPCSDDADYHNKLNSINRMITTIDGVSMSKLAVFYSLEPAAIVEMQPTFSPEDPVVTFLVAFLTHFDSDRQVGKPSIMSSAYSHDAAFSLHYMARGAPNPDFAPISMRRNVGMLLSALPPSHHNLDSLIIEDIVPVFGDALRLVQFSVDCIWSAAHQTKYRRTLLLSKLAQKPWDLTIINDQIQMECDMLEYNFIFSTLLNSASSGGGMNTNFVSQQAAGSIRASAVNVTRQWNQNQGRQKGGFQNQQRTQGQHNFNSQNQQPQQGGRQGRQQGGGNQQNQRNQPNHQNQQNQQNSFQQPNQGQGSNKRRKGQNQNQNQFQQNQNNGGGAGGGGNQQGGRNRQPQNPQQGGYQQGGQNTRGGFQGRGRGRGGN